MYKQGVILMNLGTPANHSAWGIIQYLREFLMDHRVIELPYPIRWLLVNAFIVPFRFLKTQTAYQKIWTPLGSPLMVNSQALKKALSETLGSEFQVELAMRYGKSDLKQALINLKACSQITFLPLYPQYANATNGTAIAKFLKAIRSETNFPNLNIIKDFYSHPKYIEAIAANIQNQLSTKPFEQLIFSYHGLPEKAVVKNGCHQICNNTQSCSIISTHNKYCYKAQCYTTSNLIANHLKLSKTAYKTAFQSRLGKISWIKPYTDQLLIELIQQGVKNIAIVCPSFVTDCLETLEEVNIRFRENWYQLGGKSFNFISCLNDHPLWIKALKNIVTKENA